ncbi:MAG: division/cell wall cluster transcriptional repressor MraZ [Acidaminococcaceae bacterium]
MGEFQHNIDAKGRLFMPAKLREALSDHFVVTRGLDGCLFVYDNQNWEVLVNKLKQATMMKKEARDVARYFFAGATEVECDKQGRILLPLTLRTHAALDKDTVIVGVGNRAEIWDAQRWQSYNAVISAEVTENVEQLVDLGI